MFVKVAIDLSLDRLFTYSVPEEFQKKLAVGQLLLVPFGHRHVRGFAMELDNAVSENSAFKIKPVEGIVDETPFFSPLTLKLVKTIALYTASPIESVLKAAIPAAVVKPGARSKEQLFVSPISAPVDFDGLTGRLKWLYENIVRLDGGWMQFLCKELGTTSASIKALEKKGFVEIAPRRKRRNPMGNRRVLPSRPLCLNAEQASALQEIKKLAEGKCLLLHGVTGSGKTEVYLQAIAAELESGRGAIVMVPEIALTPQTVQRFASRFGERIAVLHSALSDGERYDEWHRIRSGDARVVIGPRSAVFAPVENLGLIIVDEEHETSYKQDEMPRYHGRDVAVMRASIEGAKVVLGSATPSLETWMNVSRGKYASATMTSRAGAGTLPNVLVVDMANSENGGKIFSGTLMDSIASRLERCEQTILFLNRRGYSKSLSCSLCGYVATCGKCDMPYTYHKADNCCRCHICGGWIPVPARCPECGGAMEYKGVGTQRAEAALKACFKRARILRMDADSTRGKNSHDDILGAFRRHEADILIGTQMIAKGLDFPNVTLVGVLNADSSLSMPDFRAAERTFQLIAQVVGRAGRAELPGEAIIQTYNPAAGAIKSAAAGDFVSFAKEELEERKAAFFPPYSHLCVISLRSKDAALVESWAEMYAASLKKVKDLVVGDAVPSAIEKADEYYRWQIVVRSVKVSAVIQAWKWISLARPAPAALKVSFDVDAFSFV
ncbi:MAG: primosomal protein N' [Kiritimatiellae bacterium]|nr:primosomal protein N' [Kiritimatiellia bacterium]